MDYNKEERTATFDAFVHMLEELSGIVSQLTKAENDKAKAASAGEHGKMDAFLKEEQALLLKLRGLEQQRNQRAVALGWKDLTFRQILDLADEKERAILSPLFTQMENQVKELTDAKDSSNRIISVRLREFEHILGVNSRFPEAEGPSHFHNRYV